MGHASDRDRQPGNPKDERPGEGAGKKVGDSRGKGAPDLPAGGPHADPALTNPDATPGAGTLPEAGDADATDSTSG